MKPLVSIAAALALLAVGPALPALASTPSGPAGELVIHEEISIAVPEQVSLDSGAVHASGGSSGIGSLSLEAERITLNYTELDGEYIQPTDRDSLVEYDPDGRTHHRRNLTHVTAQLTDTDASPQILGVTAVGAQAVATAHGPVTGQAVEERFLARFEQSSSSVSTTSEAPHGFSYYVDGPWPGVSSLDSATLTGDFTVFVNNLTIAGTSAEGSWEHWTGRRENPHPGGAGGNFQSRITLVHVTNGTLTVTAPGSVELLGPEFATAVDGVISAQRVSGHLSVDGHEVSFQDEGIQLVGRGELTLSALPQGSRFDGGALTSGSGLVVQPAGEFDLRGASPASQDTIASPVVGPGSTWTVLALAGLLSLAVIAWMGRTSLAHLRDKLALEWRERRMSSWLATGDRLSKTHQYERAAVWYRRVAERYPESAEAWHSLGEALEHSGAPCDASRAYEEASEKLCGDAYELVRSAKCAVSGGEQQRAIDLLVKATEMEPEEVQLALREDPLGKLVDEPRLARAVGAGEDGSRSYA